MVFFPEITDRPVRRRPGPCLADRAGRQAGARADRTTRRLGGRKAGESAATDLPGSATVVLARSEWQAVELSGGTVEYKPSLRSGYKKIDTDDRRQPLQTNILRRMGAQRGTERDTGDQCAGAWTIYPLKCLKRCFLENI